MLQSWFNPYRESLSLSLSLPEIRGRMIQIVKVQAGLEVKDFCMANAKTLFVTSRKVERALHVPTRQPFAASKTSSDTIFTTQPQCLYSLISTVLALWKH